MKETRSRYPQSHEQEVNRNSVTGECEPKEDHAPENYETTEEHRSAWMKEWIRIGQWAESGSKDTLQSPHDALNDFAVQAVIHVQVLKRVDP